MAWVLLKSPTDAWTFLAVEIEGDFGHCRDAARTFAQQATDAMKIAFGNAKASVERTVIYADGACSGNPGPGGWAFVVIENDKPINKESGSELVTTNNRMELLACIEAVERNAIIAPLTIITDSQYVQKGITEWIQAWKQNGWKTASGKPVKNQDLWRQLDRLASALDIEWKWTPGHAGDRWNEYVNDLAQSAIKRTE